MTALIITLALVGLGAVVFYFTGWFTAGINALFLLAYKHHKKVRRAQRPSRIFLIRHGESQANIDTSECSFSLQPISQFIFLL
jgi:hypothetical protein